MLPDGWWLKNPPEMVLSNAQTVTQYLPFLYAKKHGLTSSPITNPFAKADTNAGVEFFQRRNADGAVLTKKFTHHGDFQYVDYHLTSGHYASTDGLIIKMEFPDGEEMERPYAAEFGHPYDYKLLKSSAMAGSNDCIVIARVMTPEFLTKMKSVFYKNYTKEQEDAFGGDFRKFIRSETDYYIRKSDAVVMGHVRLNHLGEQLEDWLYDQVEINQPIPDSEFSLPQGEVQVAKSSEEYQAIMNKAMAAKLAASRQTQAVKESDRQVAALPWAANLPSALTEAKAENKIVLLDFTGSDWCVWCFKFDDDVLAKTNLVMVMLDFPHAKNQDDNLKKQNGDLQSKYKVDGFPTFVALDANGNEIGRQVGYLQGGPTAFIAELEKFRAK